MSHMEVKKDDDGLLEDDLQRKGLEAIGLYDDASFEGKPYPPHKTTSVSCAI